VIVKCSTTSKSKVPLMYVALQILVELTQTYKDVNVGAKVTKFLAHGYSLTLQSQSQKIMNGHLKKHGIKGILLKT